MAESSKTIADMAQRQPAQLRALETRHAAAAARPLAKALADAQADATTRWTLATTPTQAIPAPAELKALIEHIRKALEAAFHGQGAYAMREAQRAAFTAASMGIQHASRIVAMLRGIPPVDVPPETGAIADRAATGIPAAVQEEHSHALALLTTAGLTAYGLAGLKSVFSRARRAVTRITAGVATAVTSAAAHAAITVARYLGPGVRMLWVSEPGACPACAAYAGRTVVPGRFFPGGLSLDPARTVFMTPLAGPPRHPHCFPAGTVVSGPGVQATTRRWYTGEMVKVRTRSGHVLTGTPNHPVLTPQGWVGLGSLHLGADIVRDSGLERVLLTDPDDYQMPAFIEDVAGSFGSSGSVASVRVPSAPEDFHGDGSDGDVDVVYADSLLRNGREIGQPGDEGFLVDALRVPATFRGKSTPTKTLERLALPAYCGMSSLGVPPVLLWGASGHGGSVGVGLAPRFEASVAEPAVDDVAADATSVREAIDTLAALEAFDDSSDLRDCFAAYLNALTLQETIDPLVVDAAGVGNGADALSGFITRDQIVAIDRFPWSGHVYNLETSGGWYVANGIIVHNCRCVVIPWNSRWVTRGTPLPVLLQQRARAGAGTRTPAPARRP